MASLGGAGGLLTGVTVIAVTGNPDAVVPVTPEGRVTLASPSVDTKVLDADVVCGEVVVVGVVVAGVVVAGVVVAGVVVAGVVVGVTQIITCVGVVVIGGGVVVVVVVETGGSEGAANIVRLPAT